MIQILIQKSFVLALVLTMSNMSFAGTLVRLKGKILRVEKGEAILKATDGEVRLPLKKLSKKDARSVNLASGSKKEITLLLPTQVLMSE